MRLVHKRLIALFIAVLLAANAHPHIAYATAFPSDGGSSSHLTNTPSSAQNSQSNYEKAIDLKILGLLANKPADFELDRIPTRAEGTVMLIRLLGIENKVKQGSYSHPFTDVPAWANNYVGYAYQNGIAKGTGSKTFGADEPMSARQYVTLVLRAMGYADNIDFSYDNVLEKACDIGLLSVSELKDLENRSGFLRNDLVAVSYNALKTKINGSSRTLAEKLTDTDKAVFRPAAELVGLYPSEFQKQYGNASSFLPRKTGSGYLIKNKKDLVRILTKTFSNYNSSLDLDVSDYTGDITRDFKKAVSAAIEWAEEITGVRDILTSWEYVCRGDCLNVKLKYRYAESEFEARKARAAAALNKARYIVANNVSANMTEFEKEKVLHDYIVRNARYNYKNYINGTLPDEAYEEYGCLVSGSPVCEGYARGMKLLCDLTGIECMLITGREADTTDPQGHIWNIVKIDGDYYHLDVTNDDAITSDGIERPTYRYFNLTDSDMAKSYIWSRTSYPACTSIKNNYYYRYGLLADSREDFDMALAEALKKRSTAIELRVADYSKSKYSNFADVIFKSNVVTKYRYMIIDKLGIISIFDIKYSDQ